MVHLPWRTGCLETYQDAILPNARLIAWDVIDPL